MYPHPCICTAGIQSMREQGVRVVFGRWLIGGYPKVILFDIGSVWGQLNDWRSNFSHHTKVGMCVLKNQTEEICLRSSPLLPHLLNVLL